jgi:hypothetical protein
LLVAHIELFYALDQVHAEPESKGQAEPAQVEAITNLALDQGKLRCINQCSVSFILKLCLMLYYDWALSLYELYGIIVVIRSTFQFILVNPILVEYR